MKFINIKEIFVIIILAVPVALLSLPHYLKFVDAGRYAGVARNFLEGGGFATSFIFSSVSIPSNFGWPAGIPPLHILSIAFFFKLFGVSDVSVIASSLFFFLLGIILVFLIASRLFNKKIAFFSAVFYLFTPQILNYARDGASEPIFIFELLLITYLIIVGKKWSLLLSGVLVGLSFFTKLQSFLFAPIFLLWVFLLNRSVFTKVLIFLVGPFVLFALNKIGIIFGDYQLKLPFYLLFQQSSLFPGDDLPRSGLISQINLGFLVQNFKVFFVKFAYNLYNFYKIVFTFDNLLPSWTSPLTVVSYLLSNLKFLTGEKKEVRLFRLMVLLMVTGSFILAAATSPHIRYAHFVVPFIVIMAVEFIYNLLQGFKISARNTSLVLVSLLLIFLILPFFGTVILDARFNNKQYNTGKPPAQKVLGERIGEVTSKNDFVVTNLDTWGSWYGKRKTMLMPIDLEVLKNIDGKVKVDAVFLTDFQKDNADHPLTGEWGVMFYDPGKVSENFILENFSIVTEEVILAEEVYENRPFAYKLWVRKD